MVFSSFNSKEDYLTLNHAKKREEERRDYGNRAQKIIAKYNYKSGTPTYQLLKQIRNAKIKENAMKSKDSLHRLQNEIDNLDVSTVNKVEEVSLILHKIMKSEDAVKAIDFLVKSGLVDEFEQYENVFLKRFKGYKKISFIDFEKFWYEKSSRALQTVSDSNPLIQEIVNEVPQLKTEGPVIIDYVELFKSINTPEAMIQAIKDNYEVGKIQVGKNKRVNVSVYYKKTANASRGKSIKSIKPYEIQLAFKLMKSCPKEYVEVMNKLNQLKGESGAGLRIGHRHMTRLSRYHQLGEKMIHKGRLDEGKLSLYHPSGGMVSKKRDISDKLVKLLKLMIYEDRFDNNLYNELSMEDKKIFDELVKQSKLQYDTRFKLHEYKNPIQMLKEEYEKLTGEINIGNNNPELIKKLKSVVIELFTNKVISENDFKQLINELY